MAVQVNPPPQILLPPSLAKIEGFTSWFNAQQRMLTQLWLRTGGATDEVAGSVSNQIFNQVSVSGNYSTLANDYIRVSAAATITLNTSPVNNETVLIQPIANVKVIVSGNINGQTEYIMNHAYDLMSLRFLSSGWIIE
tara:strand:+ start:489 stop:902 length:414 start_codon:yes stop_codon:yes gene_type:complete